MNLNELYENNKDFKEYVDKYCKKHEIDQDTALSHQMVKNVAVDFEKKEKRYAILGV